MDSLTQMVLGASVGEVVLGKKVGNKAVLYGAIAGTIPDLDVLSRFFVDTVTATEWHRGFSHSLFFCLLAAPLLGWIVNKIERKSEATTSDWTRLFFWGLFTHPVLDAFTTWGTQLFWPFNYRLAFQNIFVIDPLYTIPFLVCLILAMRLHRKSSKRAKINRLGLTISTLYLLLTLVVKGITYQAFTKQLGEQGIDYKRIQNRPTPFNSILWTANIETEDAYLIGEYSLFDNQPIVFREYKKQHYLLADLGQHDKVIRLRAIAEDWYIISTKEDALYFNDLRFGMLTMDPGEERFTFSYKIIEEGNDLIVEETPKFREDAANLFSALWIRIWGN